MLLQTKNIGSIRNPCPNQQEQIAKSIKIERLKKDLPTPTECKELLDKLFKRLEHPISGEAAVHSILAAYDIPLSTYSISIDGGCGDGSEDSALKLIDTMEDPTVAKATKRMGLGEEEGVWERVAEDLIKYVCGKGRGAIEHAFRHFVAWENHCFIKGAEGKEPKLSDYANHYGWDKEIDKNKASEAINMPVKHAEYRKPDDRQIKVIEADEQEKRHIPLGEFGDVELQVIFENIHKKLKEYKPDFLDNPSFE